MSDTPRQYPACCPKCGKESGYPYHVGTVPDQPGQIAVKLRCRECGHEWTETVESKP